MKNLFVHRRNKGFTLVELMVTMVIGLLIVLALITLLTNVSRNTSELGKTNRVIENGRFAMQLLETDVAHAGYWGGFVPQFDDLTLSVAPADVPTAVPDPCLTYSPVWSSTHVSNLIGIPVQGYEIPTSLTPPVCSTIVSSPKASTDLLVLRHAETCVPGVGTCPALVGGHLYMQVARCGTTAPVPAYVVAPYVAASVAADFPMRNNATDCATAPVAELRKFVSNIYYIRDYATTVGDGIPTLMRAQFGLAGGSPSHLAAEPMIEGIEGFRVEFGIDNISDSAEAVNFTAPVVWANPSVLTSPKNRGDGTPDGNYVRCTGAVPCSVEQLMNAVSVKLYVLARSDTVTAGYTDTKTYAMGSTTLGPFNDGYKRHLFTQTVRLNNLSSRRETPL